MAKLICRPVTIDPVQRHTIGETTALLRQSRAKTYTDIRSGKLKVKKDGARTYVLGAEIIRRSAESDIPDILGMRPSITL